MSYIFFLDVYDGPSPEAIRRASLRSNLPGHAITEFVILDPYPYKQNGCAE